MSGDDNRVDARIPVVDFEDLLKCEQVAGVTGGADPPVVSDPDSTASDGTTSQVSPDREAHMASETQGGDTGNQFTTGRRRAWRLPSLDPVFYVIVALAALGLVGSLYALISQNNAYFDREFQQLQSETAALNARLAANDVIIAGSQTVVPGPPVAAPEAVAPSESVLPAARRQESPPVAEAQLPPETLSSETASAEVSETVTQSTDQPMVQESIVTADVKAESHTTTTENNVAGQAIDSLKQEVQSLQAAIQSQEVLIKQLLQQNRAMTKQSVGSTEVPSKLSGAVAAATSSVAEPAILAEDTSDVAEQATAAPEVVVSMVTRSRTAPSVNPTTTENADINALIVSAYNAYRSQKYESALQHYERAVQFDPYSRDANLGIAASAQFTGDFALAKKHYRHLLSLDPVDTAAFSGWLNLPGADGGNTELELLQHAQQQGSPAELFAILGNYFAQNARWSDAQSAFEVALRGESNNADYLFNYAVVLDNLTRHREAIDFYTRALGSTAGEYSFDRHTVQQRLDALAAES